MYKRSKNLWVSFATVFGIGWIKTAPGSWASVLAALLWYILEVITKTNRVFLSFVVVFFAVFSVVASSKALTFFEENDPPQIVIDEVAGFFVGALISPAGYILALLFLFRIFDILKPFPVSFAEKLSGGLGVVADDIVAGFMAGGLIYLFDWFYYGGGMEVLLR